jgi:hypothetical protein
MEYPGCEQTNSLFKAAVAVALPATIKAAKMKSIERVMITSH